MSSRPIGKRRIPYDKPLNIPAILRFPKSRHRQLAIKWGFGRFRHLSTSLLEEKFGAIVDTHLRELQTLLSRYNLSEEETRVAEESLGKFLHYHMLESIPPSRNSQNVTGSEYDGAAMDLS